MAETLANILDLTKQVWTQDRLERQFYNQNRWLDKVERTNRHTIGNKATVPLEGSLPGGTSSFPSAGMATLNAADALHVETADYTLTYHAQQIELQIAAMAQADAVGARSTVDVVDQTITSNLDALRRDINRQAVSNGDALIALTTGTATSAEIELATSGYGYDAIVRGWLRPGQAVDIGTTADEDSISTGSVNITAVEEVAATPSITVDESLTLSGTTYVSIADARSGTTSYETNGLRNIVGSSTSAIGGLDPDTAGDEFWKPARVDTTTTLVSLDLLTELQQAVFQKSGKFPSYVTTSPKQAKELYLQFQNQVRFSSDSGTGAGAQHSFSWNGMEIAVDPDIPDRELYMLTLEDFLIVTGGRIDKPTWASDIEGSGGRLRYVQGGTTFKDTLFVAAQIAVKRRNRCASAIGLTG